MAQFHGKPKGGTPKTTRGSYSPRIKNPRCKICNSDQRGHIDLMLTSGIALREIAKFYTAATGDEIHHTAVNRHKNNHLDLRQRALRSIIEKRVVGDLDDAAAAAGDLIDRRTMLEVVVHEGFQRLVDDKVHITLGEWLGAISRLDEMDREEKTESIAMIRQEMAALTNALKLVLTGPQLEAVWVAFQRGLGDSQSKPMISVAVEDAMLVEGEEIDD